MRLPILFLAGSLLVQIGLAQPAVPQTCASNCGPRPIQFTPGQRIRLVLVNRTPRVIQVEKIFATEPLPLLPGQELEIDSYFGTTPNVSVAFWDAMSRSLRAVPSQPAPQTLKVDLFPGQSPGDRSVYVQSDGRVVVL